MRECMFVALSLLTLSPVAAADELFGEREPRPTTIGEIRPLERTYRVLQPESEGAKATQDESKPFGTKGSQWFTVGVGAANNFGDATDANVRIAWSHFIVDRVEFSAELNGWYHNQPGDDAVGINPAVVFRWHFIEREHWTMFSDVGIGILVSTDDVPDGGTSFNFTPRVGWGITYRLADDGTRLQVGVRWHHISNARIRGDSNNPARDGVMLYAGLVFPF